MQNKTKICITCNKRKHLKEFPKNSSSKDGLRNECKICKRNYYKYYARKWRAKNYQHFIKRYRKWQNENKDKVRGYSKKYYWSHREKEILRHIKGNIQRNRRLRFESLVYYGGNP